jgi:hypothetical protein
MSGFTGEHGYRANNVNLRQSPKLTSKPARTDVLGDPSHVVARKPVEPRPEVAKAFVKHMRAYYAEPNTIERDRIAGGAAFLLEPYLPPRQRRLRLFDVKEMFQAMKGSGMSARQTPN